MMCKHIPTRFAHLLNYNPYAKEPEPQSLSVQFKELPMKKIDTNEFKELLNDSTRRIEAAEDNIEINTIVEKLVTSLLDSEFASFWLFDEQEASLVRERGEGQVREVSMLEQHGVLSKSFLTLSGGIYNYIASEKEYRPEIDNPDNIRMKSKIILPLIDREQLLGIVTAYSSVRHKQNFDEDDMELLEAAAPFLINVIYRMQPDKLSESTPQVYLSDRLKEASVAVTQKVEVIREEKKSRETSDATLSFLANTVHDIRTPANALAGFLELLEGQIDNPRMLQYVKNAKESARFINDLTTSILDRVSSQRERAQQQPQQISPTKFLADIAEVFSANMSVKRLGYTIYIDPALPKEVTIEASKLKRVIMNLIGNAYKFTPTGKSVEFAAVYDSDTGSMHVSVTDTGIGIAEEHQQSIFEAFKQATDETAEEFGGTGLGLAISAQYVKELGGELKLSSELDKGSLFYFSCPLNAVNPAPTFPAVKNAGGKIAILMDESNLPTSKTIMRYLMRMGVPKASVTAVGSLKQIPADATHLIVFQNKFSKDVQAHALDNGIAMTLMEEAFLSMADDPQTRNIDVISQYSYYAPTLHAVVSSQALPRVLVADDDRINIELIKAILEEEFCKVETTQDGKTAFELLENGLKENNPFKVVFLDKQMPGMAGDDVLRKVREMEKQLKSEPVYAVSISGDPKLDITKEKLFNSLAGKPFNKKEIKETLKKALAKA